jgi:hypothetical protein
MRKGSLKLLLSLVVMATTVGVFAASPTLGNIPIIVISDAENNLGTVDNNLFVFTDAFVFDDFDSDADTTDSELLWTYDYDTSANGVELTINGIDPTSVSGDVPWLPTNAINASTTQATLRNTRWSSPALSAPFADPTGAVAQDVDGDGNDDQVVGDVTVTFMVADNQATASAVGTRDTFVFTVDTDLATTTPGDTLVDNGLPFDPVNLVVGTDDNPINSDSADWYYRSWNGTTTNPGNGGVTGFAANWLDNSNSGTAGGNFSITGTGNGTLNGSFGASYGEWILPGDARAKFVAGRLYAARAALAIDGDKTASDQIRLGIQENTVATVNQTYVVNAGTEVLISGGTDIGPHPFLPATNVSRAYISIVDPIDLDVAANSDGDANNDLTYLLNFDFVNLTSVAQRTATMSSYEIGSGDSGALGSETAAIAFSGSDTAFDGSNAGAYTGWAQLQGGAITLLGGTTILVDVASTAANAGSVVITTSDQNETNAANISFSEMSNFTGATTDIDVADGLIGGASYVQRYDINMTGGSASGLLPGNTNNYPSLRLRAATPIASFSIEYAVSHRTTNAFTGGNGVFDMFYVASTQFAGGTSGGEEDDAQIIFGVQDFEYTDGSATLNSLRILLLNADDPNVDY